MQNPVPTRIARSPTILKPIRADPTQLPGSNSTAPNNTIANPPSTNPFSSSSDTDATKSPTKSTAFAPSVILEPPESFTAIPPRKSFSGQGRRPSSQHRTLSFRPTGDTNAPDSISRSRSNLIPGSASLPRQSSSKSLITMSSHDEQAILGDDFLTRALASVGNNGPMVRIGSFSAAAASSKTNPVAGGGGGASHAAGSGNVSSSTDGQSTQVSGNAGAGSLAVPALSNGGGDGFAASKTRRQSLVRQGSFKVPAPGNRRRESEFRMTIPIFNFPKEKKKRTLLIEGIPHDIDRLISMCRFRWEGMQMINLFLIISLENSLKNKSSKSVPGLMALLKSDLFEHFLKCAVTYSRYN